MFTVECRFPSINRIARLVCSPTQSLPAGAEGPSFYLGCHTGAIGNVYLKIPEGSSASLGDWLHVLDKSKENDADLYSKTTFGKAYKTEEIVALKKALETYELPEDERAKLFKQVAAPFIHELGKHMSTTWQPKGDPNFYPYGPTFVVLADNINAYTPDFPKNSGIASHGHVRNCKTSDFAKWLRDSKTGVLVGSPIGRNQHHGSPKNFSLTQMWIWTPPQHCGFLLPESWFISGTEAMPKSEDWYNKVKVSLPHLKTPAEINTAIFKEGKPPIFTRPQI